MIRRLVLTSWAGQMRKNDGRSMPPLDLSFMVPYAEESESTRDVLMALAAQFENRKVCGLDFGPLDFGVCCL